MVREPLKPLIIFTVLLVLGILTSGAISVSQAIVNTEANLLRRTPPLATILIDIPAMTEYARENDHWPIIDPQSSTIFEIIGNLPYVRTFDYAVYAPFFSNELVYSIDLSPYSQIDWLTEAVFKSKLEFWGPSIIHHYFYDITDLEQFYVKGVYNYNVVDEQEGLINLISGRVFTQEEAETGAHVVLIPQAFAEANNLEIGSVFALDMHIFDTYCFEGYFGGFFEPDAPILNTETIELEVIGIFQPTVVMDETANMRDVEMHIRLNMRMYVPVQVTKMNHYFQTEHIREFYPNDLERFEVSGLQHRFFIYTDVMFVLYDSLDLARFNEAASAYLSEFRYIHDLRHEFSEITNSMAGLQGISNFIIVGVSISSLVILGLLILLFLHDRRKEIGLYLALGESKKGIVVQMLVEVISLAILAMGLSLFIGNILADRITNEMLLQDITSFSPTMDIGANDFREMGFATYLTGEQMFEFYAVNLDISVMILFIGVSTTMILISTILPILYITRLSPKEILMQAKIE